MQDGSNEQTGAPKKPGILSRLFMFPNHKDAATQTQEQPVPVTEQVAQSFVAQDTVVKIASPEQTAKAEEVLNETLNQTPRVSEPGEPTPIIEQMPSMPSETVANNMLTIEPTTPETTSASADNLQSPSQPIASAEIPTTEPTAQSSIPDVSPLTSVSPTPEATPATETQTAEPEPITATEAILAAPAPEPTATPIEQSTETPTDKVEPTTQATSEPTTEPAPAAKEPAYFGAKIDPADPFENITPATASTETPINTQTTGPQVISTPDQPLGNQPETAIKYGSPILANPQPTTTQ
jgi:hypothetical protein